MYPVWSKIEFIRLQLTHVIVVFLLTSCLFLCIRCAIMPAAPTVEETLPKENFPEQRSHPYDDIEEAKIRVDCGPFGEFKFCVKNLICFQHPDGMWDLQRRPRYRCNPHNATHYGCQCRWSMMTDGTCAKIPCITLMREYFATLETKENGLTGYWSMLTALDQMWPFSSTAQWRRLSRMSPNAVNNDWATTYSVIDFLQTRTVC